MIIFTQIIYYSKKEMIAISIKDITKIKKRRYLLRNIGLEIFTKTETYFFNFQEETRRKVFYDKLFNNFSQKEQK